MYLKTDIRKSCHKIIVSDIFWHILLTISLEIDPVGIEFAADRFHAKMDATAKTIDISTNVVKDGAPAAAAIMDASIAVPQISNVLRQLGASSDVLGMSNFPPLEADMMTYWSVRANDLTNLGLAANDPNGSMKGNEDEVAAAANLL